MADAGQSFTDTYHHKIYPDIDPSQPVLSAKGKVVWVTGGNQGIGAAVAEAFVSAQATAVIITGRNEATLRQTQSSLEEHAHRIKADTIIESYVNDILDSHSFSGVIAAIRRLGKIDILVNNAGVLPEILPLAESNADNWWLGFEINVRGSYNVIKHFLCVADPGAVIINVSTLLAHISVSGYSSYGPSKSAMLKVFDVVRKEHPLIRIHNFHPGIVATAMNADGHVNTEDDGNIIPS